MSKRSPAEHLRLTVVDTVGWRVVLICVTLSHYVATGNELAKSWFQIWVS